MEDKNKFSKLVEQKKYGAHKYSEYTRPQSYKPQSTDRFGPSQAQTTDLYTALQEKGYKHRYTAEDKLNKSNMGQYRSAKDTFQEVSPFAWRKQLRELENLTPEQFQLCRFTLDDYRKYKRRYCLGFVCLGLSFNYWQRMFLPRWFYGITFAFSLSAGYMLSFIQAYKGFVINLDKLGKEYELSRMIKQNLFDAHPDLSAPQRAKIYMAQNKENEQTEKRIKEEREKALYSRNY